MDHPFVLKLHPLAHVETPAPNMATLALRHTLLRLRLTPNYQETLERLGKEGVSLGIGTSAATRYLLIKLQNAGALVWEAQGAFSLIPMTLEFRDVYRRLSPQEKVRASRFAMMRSEGGRMILESPLSSLKVTVLSPLALALWGLLATARTAQEIAAEISISEQEAREALELLVAGGMAEATDAEGKISEDRNDTLRMWTPQDALFHARSRRGRHDYPLGAVFPFVGEIEHAPARKPALASEPILLARPDMEALKKTDMTLAQAVETRRSIRNYDPERRLSLEQLGHFLYRSVRSLEEQSAIGSPPYVAARRIYPNGGAMGELETYVVVRECEGLEPGGYHYDSWEHALRRVSGEEQAAQALLLGGQFAAQLKEPPPLLLILAARAPRFMWKYQGMAYACILKHVGVVMQTWYLTATAMGLAACANGAGDAETFARLTGEGFFEEASVGEMMLGVPLV